jgi:DIM1 family U5 snRNP protein
LIYFAKVFVAATVAAMVYHVEHLDSAQAVDDAINREGEGSRLAVVRFGRSGHDDCGR